MVGPLGGQANVTGEECGWEDVTVGILQEFNLMEGEGGWGKVDFGGGG